MSDDNGIKFLCSHCSQSLDAESNMSGQVINCPICQKSITIPGNRPFKPKLILKENIVSSKPGNPPLPMPPSCKCCGAKLPPDASVCLKCNRTLNTDISLPPISSSLKTINKDPAPAAPTGKSERRCPSCGVPIGNEAVLCINCGFNLKTGKTTTVVIEEDAKPGPGGDMNFALKWGVREAAGASAVFMFLVLVFLPHLILWHGFGITLLGRSRWFDLVLMAIGISFSAMTYKVVAVSLTKRFGYRTVTRNVLFARSGNVVDQAHMRMTRKELGFGLLAGLAVLAIAVFMIVRMAKIGGDAGSIGIPIVVIGAIVVFFLALLGTDCTLFLVQRQLCPAFRVRHRLSFVPLSDKTFLNGSQDELVIKTIRSDPATARLVGIFFIVLGIPLIPAGFVGVFLIVIGIGMIRRVKTSARIELLLRKPEIARPLCLISMFVRDYSGRSEPPEIDAAICSLKAFAPDIRITHTKEVKGL